MFPGLRAYIPSRKMSVQILRRGLLVHLVRS
jgi:hypothetical protein